MRVDYQSKDFDKWFTYEQDGAKMKCLIRRVLPENYRLSRLAQTLNTDSDAYLKWCEAMAKDVLIDWQGAQDESGAAMPATQEAKSTALRIMGRFALWVWTTANTEAGYLGNGTGSLLTGEPGTSTN